MSMLKLPIQRPVTVMMLFFGLALLGVISWMRQVEAPSRNVSPTRDS